MTPPAPSLVSLPATPSPSERSTSTPLTAFNYRSLPLRSANISAFAKRFSASAKATGRDAPSSRPVPVSACGSLPLLRLALQMQRKKLIHAMPRIPQHVRPRKIVELPRIHHVREQVAFPFLQRLIDQPHRLQVRHVHVRR